MKKLISSETNTVRWLPEGTLIETFISDETPPVDLCPSVYAFVFKDGELLQTDLREGERPTRMLDIPGGHVDEGETPERAITREVFEETGVKVVDPKLVAYKKITVMAPKPDDWQYPYPAGYMLFYMCKVVEETPFDGNHEVHGRVWIKAGEYEQSEWYVANKLLTDEVIKEYLKY